MLQTVEYLTERINPVSMSMYTVVKVKESGGSVGKEIADIISVSSSGAGFILKRRCSVGHLVSLTMPLPPHQRSYDHKKELYSVWGLVQHCHEVVAEGKTSYHVGVAFIGKHAPHSYDSNPDQNYRICGMADDGLWMVKEAAAPFKTRKDLRFWKSIDLYLALLDSQKGQLSGERTTTENISRSGAAVISTLDVNVGDRVKFINEKYDFSGLAVVCNRQIGEDKRTRLHLQFVESRFPVELIKSDEMETAAN